MSTLLLRCAGPMQSWGTRSRFQERDTEREPTKSGIIGLISAAMGIDRDTAIDNKLLSLRIGIRVDREGTVQRDYHTTLAVLKSDKSGTDTQLSNRAYLADASFLVGLEGDDYDLLCRIHKKLANPVWPTFLGRKAFVPCPPVYLHNGLQENKPLEIALRNYPVDVPVNKKQEDPMHLRLVLESDNPDTGERRWDQPVSFEHGKRRFACRFVETRWITVPSQEED
ncbi:MAG: type I-E CRISPR-associated protein Cas5/CasD [Deltaproteobacteria bacterium]|nr:type I-E CRISPR-associated protein Cas5/CasD [Deltaproteobacteria bacterium]